MLWSVYHIFFCYTTKMIPLVVIKKILLFLAPLVVLYFLRKFGKKKINKTPFHSDIDKSSIVEGEIVKEKK